MSHYLFDNAVMDRYARIANGLDVEPGIEFADRLLWLATVPAGKSSTVDLDTFLDRVHLWRRS